MQLQQTSYSCKCGSSKHSTVIKAYTKATIGFISKNCIYLALFVKYVTL